MRPALLPGLLQAAARNQARGFADLSLTGVVGFKFDRGLRLVPKSESLDDQEDWHFTVYAGLTLPTGDANIRDVAGTGTSPAEQLGRLADLHTAGKLTDDEYAAAKAQVVAGA